jgi:hypothetical protein
MRQSSLIAALGVLVLLAALAAWFFLRPAQSGPVNAAGSTGGFSADHETDPLKQPANDASRLPINAPDGTNPESTDPESTDEPGEGQWLLCGRISITPELARLMPAPEEWMAEAQIQYLADGREPDNALSFYVEMDEQRAFREIVDSSEFAIEEDALLPPGKWQLLYADGGDSAPSLSALDEIELPDLKGIVIPTISGRVVDFGTVTIGVDEFFYQKVILTGRIMHSSGRPLAFSGIHNLEGRFNETEDWSWEIYGDFFTAVDGTFCAVTWLDHPSDLSRLPKYTWSMEMTDEVEWAGATSGNAALGQPAWNGRVANFGDITLAGALVEITLKCDFETSVDADGKLLISRWGDYDGDYVNISFEGADYRDVRVFPQPHTTVTVLPEGRYIWTASPTSAGFYPFFSGLLLAREGQAYKIELDLSQFPSVPLLVTGVEPVPGGCLIDWEVMRAEKAIGNGSFYYGEDPRVPLVEGCETTVFARCEGFKEASAVARPGMTKLEVKLEEDDRPKATLVVVVPVFPEGTTPDDLLAVIHVTLPEGAVTCKAPDAPLERSFVLHDFGACTVTLRGGQAWGYAGGVLSGPVEFEIAAGETKRVKLPPIAAPPWSKPINSINVRAKTSGHPMTLTAHLRYKELADPVNESMTDGGNVSVRGVPVAITDGREDYPVLFTPGEDGQATLSFDFPHNIELRLTRAGKPVDEFQVSATTLDVVAPHLSAQCEVFTNNGIAKLWVPRGRVNLDMRINGVTVCSQQAEVIPGQVLQVEAGSALLQLTLELADESYDPYASDTDAPPLWTLQLLEEDGNWYDYSALSAAVTFMLDAGKYRVVPWNGGENVEIELSEDRTVRLPEIATPKFGAVVLKFDVASLGDAYAEANFYYQMTDKLKPGERWIEERWTTSSLVPDGFKLSGMPLDADIAVWGSVWVEDDGEGFELMLRPLQLRITKDGQQVEAYIRRGVELDEEWYGLDARWVTPVENLTRELGESALPGRNELAVYRDEEIVFRDWVIIPETSSEPFKIPDALRRELESRELIEPREEE